ncbi:hypothetical protein GCM10009430_49250 [Aquimarina litoralis]|uniref:DUF2147 domain-containing protein n=1 Tax=Aquimarina litoralis TaxID=584605 RepID=A0ABP3UND5_9FLAO
MKKTLLVFFLSIFSFNLSSYKPFDNENNQLIGIWVYSNYSNGTRKYVKSKSFKKDTRGIEFKKDGIIIQRKNTNWCATQPYTPMYRDCNGNWEFKTKSIFTIKLGECGRGLAESEWKIIKLTNESLEIKSIN